MMASSGASSGVLSYTAGSPFARMARVLVREWSLPIEESELSYPPPPEWFAVNPLGQIPVLALGREQLFPTLVILERLWELAGKSAAAYAPGQDRQVLATTLLAGDALVAAAYIKWTGLGPVGRNAIGFDLTTRHGERVQATLAWLAGLRRDGRLRDGITLCGVALACLILWAEARDGVEWRQHAELVELIDSLAQRLSFAATKPRAWHPEDRD